MVEERGEKQPTVDAVIPVYKPDAAFGRLMRALAAQSFPLSHILLINTEEKYFRPELIEGMANVEVFHISKKEFDHGGTRNMGAGFSGADYVLFMTQDAVPKDRYLVERLVGSFSNKDVKVAYARQLPNGSCGVIERYTRQFNYPDTSAVKTKKDIRRLGIKAFFCSDVCAMYDRNYLVSNGGFEVPCIFNEDMIFAGKTVLSGGAVAYCAEARVVHSHNYTARQQFERNFDNGVSQAMHPEVFKSVAVVGEGKKLVKQTALYLKESGQKRLIFKLVFHSAAKFMGFKLGKAYKRLPKRMRRAFSMNKSFWDEGHAKNVKNAEF